MIQDQYSDRSFRVFAAKVREFNPGVRDLIKEAEVNLDEYAGLPETAFAWPEMRKLAIHTPEHTTLSMIYAHDENLPEHVKNNLEKAAALYDIELPTIEKVASVVEHGPDDYLIPEKKFGLIGGPGQVKEASRFFSDNYKKMDVDTRTNAAATIVKKAREYDVKVSPSLYKHAGYTECNPRVLGEWLEVRGNLTKDPAIKAGFDKLAEHVMSPNMRSATREDMVKVAGVISILDTKAALEKKYDITLPDPVLTVFNTTKVAGESVTLANKQVPVSKLMQIEAETYGDILGDDIIPEISEKNGSLKQTELLDVLSTLPADLQTTLVSTLGF